MQAETITLSELQRTKVWEGWLSSEILSHYFGELAERYQSRQRRLTWLTLLFSSGAAATLLSDWLPRSWSWAKPILALITAAISLLLVVEQNGQRAIDCSDLYFQWSRLASEYEALWDDMYSEDAPAKLSALDDRAAALSRRGTTMPSRTRLLVKWQDYVEKRHQVQTAA